MPRDLELMTLGSKVSIPVPFLSNVRRNQAAVTIKMSAEDDPSRTIAPRRATGGAKIAR